jgi:hypothetical protein|tara:strand:+ start:275 stop:472 length:198 start_codon:yes stop_codon:yes gene_type:complete
MPRGIGTYGSKRGRPKKKKKSYGAGGSTSLKKMKAASAYRYGGMTGSNKMTVQQFRHGGMCKRGM